MEALNSCFIQVHWSPPLQEDQPTLGKPVPRDTVTVSILVRELFLQVSWHLLL